MKKLLSLADLPDMPQEVLTILDLPGGTDLKIKTLSAFTGHEFTQRDYEKIMLIRSILNDRSTVTTLLREPLGRGFFEKGIPGANITM